MSAVEDTRTRILGATAELFAERGYANTSTRQIAQRAGVNEVTLFRHFKNKQGILQALSSEWRERMAGFAVEQLPAPDDTVATLESLVRLEIEQSKAAGPVAMRLVLDARMSPEVAEVLGKNPSDNFGGMVEYLTQRQAAGDLRQDIDPAVMAEAFFSLTSQVIMSRQVLTGSAEPRYQMSAEEAGRQLFDIFLRGVATTKVER